MPMPSGNIKFTTRTQGHEGIIVKTLVNLCPCGEIAMAKIKKMLNNRRNSI